MVASSIEDETRGSKECAIYVNMRNLVIRLQQRLGNVQVQHVDGKCNVADLFTKEMKDSQHFLEMADMVTSPREILGAAAA